jgi:hypothetical protein
MAPSRDGGQQLPFRGDDAASELVFLIDNRQIPDLPDYKLNGINNAIPLTKYLRTT